MVVINAERCKSRSYENMATMWQITAYCRKLSQWINVGSSMLKPIKAAIDVVRKKKFKLMAVAALS
jgi:hypothetical protein